MATVTIYASPDAYLFNDNASSWAALRAEAGSNIDQASATEATLIGEKATNWNLARNPYVFDTSVLGAGATINSAVFSLKSTTSTGNGTETTNPANGALVGVTPANPASLAATDFSTFGTTRYADSDVTRSAFANGSATYKDWTLNATGIAAINKTGVTALGIRPSNDFSDATAPTARSFAIGYFSADATQTNRPKLVIDYTAASGPANLKSLDTNVKANIKSYNTNPIANVKSINTNV